MNNQTQQPKSINLNKLLVIYIWLVAIVLIIGLFNYWGYRVWRIVDISIVAVSFFVGLFVLIEVNKNPGSSINPKKLFIWIISIILILLLSYIGYKYYTNTFSKTIWGVTNKEHKVDETIKFGNYKVDLKESKVIDLGTKQTCPADINTIVPFRKTQELPPLTIFKSNPPEYYNCINKNSLIDDINESNQKLIGFKIYIENIGDNSINFSTSQFSLLDQNKDYYSQKAIDDFLIPTTEGVVLYKDSKVQSGAKIEGWIVIKTSKDSKELELKYRPFKNKFPIKFKIEI